MDEIRRIVTIFSRDCLSVSKKSELTYEVGEHSIEKKLYLRIVKNTRKGTWSSDWTDGDIIDSFVKKKNKLTGRKLFELQPGRSNNTGGFILAALKNIGFVRRIRPRSPYFAHVPGTSFSQLIRENIAK